MNGITRWRNIAMTTLSLALLLGCAVEPPPAEGASSRARTGPARVEDAQPGTRRSYHLVSIGGERLPYEMWRSADRPCASWLRAGRYELAADTWAAIDTLVERCADRTAEPESSWVRRDTGVYRMRGDTIQFEVIAPGPGEPKVVLLGLLRGDTLTAWGSDLDGGDFVYAAPAAP